MTAASGEVRARGEALSLVRIVTVVGARPNFVKLAPLIRAMRGDPELVPIVVHTGQHYDGPMSEQFFTDLELPRPDFNLGVGSGSHAVQTAEVMQRFESILDTARPDLVVVVGDVNSTLAAALTAVKCGIQVAHVEAGLRSFDRTMPEEINRHLTDAVSDFLFVTEESGRANLRREGIAPKKIHFVGNVMIDALETFRPRWEGSSVFDRLGLERNSPYGLLTLHRPSNVDDPRILMKILEALRMVARHLPIVFPLHPRVKQQLIRQGYSVQTTPDSRRPLPGKGLGYLDPLGYLDFVALMSRARLVLTDSGGVQEETTALGVPCLTLRDSTERPVTLSHGTNRVIGSDPDRLVEVALQTLHHPPRPNGLPPLWDGKAAKRIVQVLADHRRRHRASSTGPAPC